MANAFDDIPDQPAIPPEGAAPATNAFADLPTVSEQAAKTLAAEKKSPGTWGDLVHDAESGVMRGFAGLAGMVPDVVPNAAAVGTSLYDVGAHYLGGKDWADLPRPNAPNPVTRGIEGLLDKSPITSTQLNRPDLAANRYAATAGSLIPGAAAGGGGLAATARNAAVMAPGAAAGQALVDTGRPTAGTLAQALLSVPAARSGGAPTAKGTVTQAGQELGLQVSPSTTNPSALARGLESLAGGKQKIHQFNSLANEGAVNGIAREEIGLDGTKQDAISDAEITQAKQQAQVGRDAVRNAGQISTPPNFDSQISALQQANQGAARVVPGLMDRGLNSLLNGMKGTKTFNAADGVDAISALREKASTAYKNGDSSTGAAYKGAANVLENAIDAHLSRPGAPPGSSDLINGFRQSRQTFAKIYAVDEARSDQGNVLGTKLASSDAPLTGKLKTIADTAAQDKKSFAPAENSPGVGGSHGNLGGIAGVIAGMEGGQHLLPHSPVLGSIGGAIAGGTVIPATRWAARQAASIPGLAVQRQKQLDLARALSAYGSQQPANSP